MSVAFIDCSSEQISCTQFDFESGIVYLPPGNAKFQQGTEIHGLDYLVIATEILQQLPDAKLMDHQDINVSQSQILKLHSNYSN